MAEVLKIDVYNLKNIRMKYFFVRKNTAENAENVYNVYIENRLRPQQIQ